MIQPTTPPPSREQVDAALVRLTTHVGVDSTSGAFVDDVAIVEAEITRLRRHSKAFAHLVGDVVRITPVVNAEDAAMAAVFEVAIQHILDSPEELDRIAEDILRLAEQQGPPVVRTAES